LASPFGDGEDDGMVVQEENTERLHEVGNGGHHQYLIEKFLGKVTNSNVRKGWAKTHLGAEKVDIEASGCYFVKWQGYSKMSDIEICAKISDGGGVPDDIFARFVRIYESEPAPKKKR
jgi:hypothetical protein